jgi:hypothetical protein
MSTGRYSVVTKGGRRFTVEPIAERNQKINGDAFTNGGIDGSGVKTTKDKGGAVRPEDSIITEENGYNNIVTLPPSVSPNNFIDRLLACETVEEENLLWNLYR